MPYEWITPATQLADATAPVAELHLWPYRSLPKKGFVWFIGITVALISIPLAAVIGSAALWGVLPFLVLTVGGVWIALQRSYTDGSTLEELRLWPDRIHLVRHNPRGPRQEWEANPHWVRVNMRTSGGPVEDYLTLTGNGREVELGAFLSVEERQTLDHELRDRLRTLGDRTPRR